LPIACSNYGPMPEVLGDAGVYFNPTDIENTYEVITKLLNDPASCACTYAASSVK
jgi:glycosyltransferase involved in cell wall biosynthesis